MSLSGEINKISGDLRRAIETISMNGMTGMDGSPLGTRKIVGYVSEIHTEGELAGTVDVQEYGYSDEPHNEAGLHKGVLLSAIQDNPDGVLIVPMLYSEVVTVENPLDGHEYVLMYSHASRIQLNTTSIKGRNDGAVRISVTEKEDFIDGEEGLEDDYDELRPTGNIAETVYDCTSITDHLGSADDENGLRQEKTATGKTITVGDTSVTIDGSNVSIKTGGEVSFTVGGTTISHKDGSVTIKTDDARIEAANCEVKGSTVTITGGTLKTKGVSSTDLNGPFNAIKVCPFSGAPHCGSSVSGT